MPFLVFCLQLLKTPAVFFFRRPAACLESRRAEKWDLCSRSEFSPKWLQLSAAHCLTYHMCKFDISDSWIAVLWNWHTLNHTPSSYISLAWEIWNRTSRKHVHTLRPQNGTKNTKVESNHFSNHHSFLVQQTYALYPRVEPLYRAWVSFFTCNE